MIAFDLSDSMDQSGKLAAASSAAQNFVQRFIDNNPSPDPHHMGLVTFKDGVAFLNVTKSPNLSAVKTTLASFDPGDTSGYTNIGEALWRAEAQLAPNRPSVPDFIVLLSDGAANRPDDLDDPFGTTETNDEVWLDVNDDGVVNSADDLAVDFIGDGDNDFIVVDGQLQWYNDKRALDANENGSLSNADDYTFGPGYNFAIIDGRLRVDANGDGTISSSDPNKLLIDSDGMVDGNKFGSDAYHRYHATQAKGTGTVIYVIGYELGSSQDPALLQVLASPGKYYDASTANIDDIFQQIVGDICPTPTPTAYSVKSFRNELPSNAEPGPSLRTIWGDGHIADF
jgi:hypothetical protein